jgi:hypothetical protein
LAFFGQFDGVHLGRRRIAYAQVDGCGFRPQTPGIQQPKRNY